MKLTQIDQTPNPNSLKFVMEHTLNGEGSHSFVSREEAERDPLAARLFQINDVENVFYMSNFITVTKSENSDWSELQQQISEALNGFNYKKPETVKDENKSAECTPDEASDYQSMTPVEKMLYIDKFFDENVRPQLAGDGGGLSVVGLEENKLLIHYEGACGTCPSSISGTLMYIDGLVKEKIDDSLYVMAV